ncbi:hypothetical protein HYPSUDRAFT_63567 [Hypholoma sublateritium FD-334 SS-4]|uniref:FAD/NAD(P)-binding domain-containing protein n=1 Tax=Hypholoma sublateritium (strain FD-334 SS-4) TaxID=945553 RepID=A0A0D2P756_HYPSF|nr:hypothetical protein HYPSUDRAFT_63567 [Hypholoma sublateritium FD-334 SS-4]
MDKQNVKKRIIVVGGGGVGTSIVRGLVKALDPSKHELTLIAPRPQFAYLPTALRVLVDKRTSIDRMFMPYDSIFGAFPGELKLGCVSSIDENMSGKGGRVVLKTGEQIAYDVLAVATGSSWQGLLAFPDKQALYEEHIELWRDKFDKAQNIVIVGGGPVGIEIAGEIKDVYPKKAVTIVHNTKYLMNDMYPQKFRVDLERRLRRRGVKIILDDAIEGEPRLDSNAPLKTREGTSLTCDLLVTAYGAEPNTSLFKFILPTPLGNKNYVEVDRTLQVRAHQSIFAAGDIVNIHEGKQFTKTSAHAKVVVKNIISYLKNEPSMKGYKPSNEIIAVSNGKKGGATYLGVLWGICFGNTFTKIAKSWEMAGVRRNNLGLDIP